MYMTLSAGYIFRSTSLREARPTGNASAQSVFNNLDPLASGRLDGDHCHLDQAKGQFRSTSLREARRWLLKNDYKWSKFRSTSLREARLQTGTICFGSQ